MRRVLLLFAFVFHFAASVNAQSPKSSLNPPATPTAATAPASTAAAKAARASFAKLPLSFEENVGQTDARVKYTSRGSGYNLFLTADEAVFALRNGNASSNCAGLARRTNSSCSDPANQNSEHSFLWLKMVGANSSAQVLGSEPLPGKINYYIGNDPKKWRTGVRQFGRISYEGIYPGVDLIYYGNQQQLESDFVVEPGASPKSIEFEVTGASGMRLDTLGNLVLTTAAGDVQVLRPGIYQTVKGAKRDISGHYVIRGKDKVGLEIGSYDKRDPLIIDPIFVYSTYLGGSSEDSGNAIAIDSTGAAYVTGSGDSIDFPGSAASGPVQEASPFAFVTKFDPTGNTLLFSTELRGTTGDNDSGNGIGLDSSNRAYVAGITSDSDFPLLNPFQATLGDLPLQSDTGFLQSGFVAGLQTDGTLIYSTYFGGQNYEDTTYLTGLAADSAGNAYVVGYTNSQNFPTINPLQAVNKGSSYTSIVAKFNGPGTSSVGQPAYSTYLGGTVEDYGYAIAVDNATSPNAYVTGQTYSTDFPVQPTPVFQAVSNGSPDAFVSKLSFNTTTNILALAASTYLGGSSTDAGYGIAVDTMSPPNVYLTGQTSSTSTTTGSILFPTLNPIFGPQTCTVGNCTEAFVTKLNGAFTALTFSTFLGGTGSDSGTGGDSGNAIAIDGANPPNVFVTGSTISNNFPTLDPLQVTLDSPDISDVFVTEVVGAGNKLAYSTYIGGFGSDAGKGIAADSAGDAYVAGTTASMNFPVFATTGTTFQTQLNSTSGNAFVLKISPAAAASGLYFFPPSFNYHGVGVGASELENVTLTNNSASAVTVNSLSFTGANAGDFTLQSATSPCTITGPFALPAASSCVLSIKFAPADQDARSATVTISSTPPSTTTLNLTGSGGVPEVSLNQNSLNFGTNDPLNVAAFDDIEITNTGGATLLVGSVLISSTGTDASAFNITENDCTSVLPNSSCFIEFTFTPTVANHAYSATLTINDNAEGSPQTVPMTGTGVGQVTVSPTSAEFGGLLVGTSSNDQEFFLTNGSGGNITLGAFTPATGADPGDFPIDTATTNFFNEPMCTANLVMLPGVTCFFDVYFHPTAGSSLDGRTATYTMSWSGTLSGSKAINLMGTGETGVTLYSNSVTASSIYIGATERQAEFDILYNGTASPITITSIVLSGANPQDYAVQLDDSCSINGVVAANSTCYLDGSFTPTALGTRTATATINYTPPSGSSLTLNVTGTGIPGPVNFPASLIFGSQIVGLTTPAHRVELQNVMKTPLAISSVTGPSGANASDFAIAPTSTCTTTPPTAVTVPGGGNCYIDLTFKPGATGNRSATITVTDNGPGSPRTLTMTGTGEAGSDAISVSPAVLDFGNVPLVGTGLTQPTLTGSFYLINGGTTATTISSATVPSGAPTLAAGSNAAFALTGGTCAPVSPATTVTVLPQGGSCSVTVTFKPASTTEVTGTVTLTDSVGGLHTVTVQGAGIDQGAFSLSSASTFYQTPSSTSATPQTITLTNTGTGPLTISVLSLTGPNAPNFAIVALPSPAVNCTQGLVVPVTSGSNTCVIGVTFTAPATVGTYNASVLVTANLGNNAKISNNAGLSGDVVSGGLGVSPTPPLNFGTVAIGTSVNFSTINNNSFITITNNNTSTVTISSVAPQTAGDFTVQSSSCTGTLSVNSTCSFDVVFAPTVNAAETNNIVITYTGTGATGSPLSIPVKGTGSNALVATPNPVTSSTSVGFSLNPQVVIGNGSSSTVTIVSVSSITGTAAAFYTFNFNGCTATLVLPAAGTFGNSCTIYLIYAPTSPGTNVPAQFTVTYTVGSSTTQQTLTVNLSSTAIAPTVSVVPTGATALVFPNTVVNKQSLVLDVVVTNTGSGANNYVYFSGFKITGANANDFALAPPSFSSGNGMGCQFSDILPGQSCTIPILFTPSLQYPSTPTSRNATLTITDNAYPSTTQTVLLEGNISGGNVFTSTTNLSFPQTNIGTSVTQDVLLTNTSSSAVTFNSVAYTGPYSSGTGPNACVSGQSVGAFTGSCVIYITFTPTAITNPGTAIVHYNGSLTLPTITLSGAGTNPNVNVSPSSLTFSPQAVGTSSSSQTVTLSNPTSSPATVSGTAPTITGTNPGDFSIKTNSCTGATLPATTGSCTVTVVFTPGAAGGTSRSATLTISDSSPAASFPITLNGTATEPVAGLSGTTMTFGSSDVGLATGQQTVTLTNTGNGTLTISSVVLGGTNIGDFALATPLSGTDCRTVGSLAASTSCNVAATFDPTATGSRSATITITDNATPVTQVITLSGTGTTPSVSLNPTTIPFGNQVLKTTSAQMTSTLTNSGTGPLTITSVTITGTNAGDFALVAPTSGTQCQAGTVAALATCTIAVTFTPQATGSRTATVSVVDSAAGSPHTLSLTGTGTAPVASVPATLSFGNEIVSVPSGSQTVTLTNTGTANLTIASVAINPTSTNPGDFAIVSGAGTTCVASFTVGFTAPNNTCTVALTFTPGAAGARGPAVLNITDNSNEVTGTVQSVNLTGTGQTPPTATLSTASVPFPNQLVGSTSAATVVTITNNGTATLAIASIVLDPSGNPGDFLLAPGATNPCPLTGGNVSGGTSCTFNVAFKPTAASARAATVDITDNGNATGTAGTKQTVGLSGTGIAPLAQVAATLPFGNQPINQTSTMSLTLTNNGTAPLTLAASNAVAITAGTNSTLFGIAGSSTCTNSLAIPASGGTCTINVTFAPTAVGTYGPVTLVITDNSGAVTGSTQSVALSGSGVAASVNFAPSPVNFTPSQNVGTTSGSVTVTLTNSGGLGVQLSATNAVAISGTNAGDFAIAPAGTTCINSATVAASGGSCAVILTFKPTATGSRTATLTVTDNANPTTQTVTLNGTGIAPLASVPATLSFGNEIVSVASGQQTVTLTNTGTSSLTIASVLIDPTSTNPGDFAIVSGAGTTCVANFTVGITAPNNTCTVALTFTPGAAGARSASLKFTDNSNEVTGTVQSVNLTGTGQTPPTATLSTASVPFPNQLVGSTSAATVVTITNNGTATLAIASIVLDPSGNPGDFLLAPGATNPCPLTGGNVSGGTSCTFNVAFKPTAASARAATVDITDNGNATGTAGTKQTVGLSGTGIAPLAQVAATLPFGNQPINQTSTMSLTLTNNGTAPLTLAASNAVAITAGTNSTLFGIAGSSTCTNSLAIPASGGTCTINVTFAPTAVGTYGPVTLVITDNSGAVTGSTQSVALSGSGVTSTVNFNPSTVAFGNQLQGTTSGQMTSVLTNSGSSALTIMSVTITGTNPGEFALVTPASGTQCHAGTVAVAGTCTVAITFTPTSTGNQTATVSVADNAVGSPHTLTLTGTGTAPAVSLGTSTVTFANQIQTTTSGAQTLTLTNRGTAPLNISTVALGGTNPGDFAIVSGAGTSCPGATVGFTAPNNTCTVALTFTPATATSYSATLTFTDNATPTTQVVTLSGTGVTPPTATPSPTNLTFTSQPTTTTSAAQPVTLTNSGGAPLSITSIALTGANPGDFAFASPATTCPTGTTGGQVAAGTNCILSVTFDPAATGTRTASITIVVNGIANPAPITLTGTGTAPDLAIAKSHVGSFEVGGNGSYTIKLTNNGTAATQHPITVTDTLPAGLTFASGSGTPASWTCNAGAQNAQMVTCTNPGPINTGAGNASTLTLTVSVAAAAFPSVTNTATVADTGDSGMNDKSATDAPTTITAPDVTISKSHTGDFVVGSNGVYTIKVTNNGTGGTTGNITVTDTLPAGLTFVSSTGTGWACGAGAQNAQVVTCTYSGSPLAALVGTSTFTLSASVAPGAFPSVTNAATVADPNDGKTTDKSATDAPTNIDNVVPTQSSFSPTLGVIAGATSAQQITLTGAGFNSSTQVTIGSNPPLTGTANAVGTSLTISVPASDLATSGNLTISVSNPKNPTSNAGGGVATTTQTFPVVGMQSIAPQSGTANPVPIAAGTTFELQMNLNLTPSGATLPADVNITCSLPASLTGAKCVPNPATITHGTTSPNTVISITAIPTKGGSSGSSTSGTGIGGHGPSSTYLLWLLATILLSMVGMLGAVRQRVASLRRAPVYLALLLLILAVGVLVGCTSMSGPAPTPIGPSTMTVTATTADGASVTTTVNITISN